MAKSKINKQTMDDISEKNIAMLLSRGLFILLLIISRALLQDDFFVFWTWEIVTLLMAFLMRPLLSRLFSNFYDGGWVFIRVLSIFIPSFITWELVSTGLIPFTNILCVVVTVIVIAAFIFWDKKLPEKKKIDLNLILVEEFLLITFFMIWTYFIGFRGEAYGVEKYMDYGFMAAMMRTKTLPFLDIWYSSKTINYYYIGQYIAVWITRITFTEVDKTYNLMRAFIAGLSFAMPFSLVYQMLSDKFAMEKKGKIFRSLAGTIAGLGVTFCGNVHYIIFGLLNPIFQKLNGLEVTDYWYADATRYIGFNPDVEDKCIHEFPSYSFVLGDLHAHVINLIFVFAFIGLLYSYISSNSSKETINNVSEKKSIIKYLKNILLNPQIILLAVLLGAFQGINYWDFAIYITVIAIVLFFTNYVKYNGNVLGFLSVTLIQMIEVYLVATLVIIPFMLHFDSDALVGGIFPVKNHSLFYQLVILWGLPVITLIMFLVMAIIENVQKAKENTNSEIKVNPIYGFFDRIDLPDLYIGILGVCALGLVIAPEIVYVKDICETGGYARANTMFKLTYQAYIMFAIMTAYAIFSSYKKKGINALKVIFSITLALTVIMCGYTFKSMKNYYGDVFDISTRGGISGTRYLELGDEFKNDAPAIRWLENNVEGTHVILEGGNRERYTPDNRVSATTGLPTVMGWYVHEWLWRGDTDDLGVKCNDVDTMYTSTDYDTVRNLIEQYNVEYIFVGEREKLKWPDNLNNDILKSMGTVVFEDGESGTYIVQVN